MLSSNMWPIGNAESPVLALLRLALTRFPALPRIPHFWRQPLRQLRVQGWAIMRERTGSMRASATRPAWSAPWLWSASVHAALVIGLLSLWLFGPELPPAFQGAQLEVTVGSPHAESATPAIGKPDAPLETLLPSAQTQPPGMLARWAPLLEDVGPELAPLAPQTRPRPTPANKPDRVVPAVAMMAEDKDRSEGQQRYQLEDSSEVRGSPGRVSHDGSGRTSVFGATGEGSKFVYVFDRSGSMDNNGGAPLRAAKAELIASLEDLQSTQQFQIIFYNERPRVFSPTGTPGRLVFGTEQNKRLAQKFIGGITADGGTLHLQALTTALHMGPDVVFFLTDADEPQMSAKELAKIAHINPGAVINTIEFGNGPQRKADNFLATLAKQNRGQHVYVDIAKLRGAKR